MAIKKSIVLAMTLAIALGACGKAKVFTATDLGTIVIGQNEAPTSTIYIAQLSGPQNLDQFASDDAEKTQLTSYHFQSATQSIFANQSTIQSLTSGATTPPPDAVLIGSLALLFKTSDDAKKALAYEHKNDLSKGTNMTSFASPKLGEEMFTEYGTLSKAPFPAYVITWRVGNAVFAVIVSGATGSSITQSQAESLAKTMNDRAQKA